MREVSVPMIGYITVRVRESLLTEPTADLILWPLDTVQHLAVERWSRQGRRFLAG